MKRNAKGSETLEEVAEAETLERPKALPSSRADKIAQLVSLVEEMERRGRTADIDPELLAAVQQYRDEQAKDDAVHEMADMIAAGASAKNATVAHLAPSEDEALPDLPLGSKSQEVNRLLFSQVLSVTHTRKRPAGLVNDPGVAATAMMGLIQPKGEIEAMLIAQMVSLYGATMDCLSRASERQSVETYREYMNQANKTSRTFGTLLQALDKHRNRGQQTVRVEHVTVSAGGQAIVGNVSHGAPSLPTPTSPAMIAVSDDEVASFELIAELTPVGGTGGARKKMGDKPKQSRRKRCGAQKRDGEPCPTWSMPNGRCRMHGGKSPGEPKGNRNAYEHGGYGAEVVAYISYLKALSKTAKELAEALE